MTLPMLARLGPRTLRARLLGAFLLLSVVPLTVVGILVYRQGEVTLTSHIFDHLATVALLKSQQIAQWIKERQRDVVRPASIPFFQREVATIVREAGQPAEQTAPRIREILDRIRSAGEFTEMFLLDPVEGRVVLSTDPEQEGKFKADRPYFREGRKGPYVQHVYYSLTQGMAMMAFSAPVPDPDGQPTAILVGRVDLRYLDRLMAERAGLGLTAQTFLVNRFNYFVSASLGRGEHGWRPVFSEGVKRALAGETGTALYGNHEGRPVVGAYRWLPELNLALIAEMDQAEAFAPISTVRLALIAAVVLVSGLAIVVGLTLAWGITRPITKLLEAARAIGQGDLTLRVEVKRLDELATLATTMNRMAEDLLSSHRELEEYSRTLESQVEARTGESEARRRAAEALAEVGRSLSQSLDPEVVAHRVVESIRLLFGTTASALYCVEPETGDLVALAASGEARAWRRESLRLPKGTGISGLAVREGRVMMSPNVLMDPRVTLTSELRTLIDAAGYHSVLAAPLLVQDRVIGVLAIGDVEGKSFTAEEMRLAQSFADQAALALENSRLYQEVQRAYEDLSRTQHQFLQAQKMEAIGRLAGGVAHDFNNLLTVIIGRSQLLRHPLRADDPLHRDLELIHRTAERAADLTRQLLAFSRKQVLEPRPLDLNDTVAGMASILRRLIGEDISLVTVLDPGLGTVKADPGQLGQVLMNLVVNARDAMPHGGTLTITTENVEVNEAFVRQHPGSRPGPHVRLSVTDTGVGMDAETQTHLFEPFFTTKGPGKGTGLGLATVYGIIKQQEGYVGVESTPGRGSTLTIYLPSATEPLESGGVRGAPSRAAGGKETVLLVEDEAEVRELARDILEMHGYHLLEAASPAEALDISQRHPTPIDLLVTDVVMPQMSGRQLAARLIAQRPTMKVAYMSGYTDEALGHHGILKSGVVLLQKPFMPDDLARTVRRVLDRG